MIDHAADVQIKCIKVNRSARTERDRWTPDNKRSVKVP